MGSTGVSPIASRTLSWITGGDPGGRRLGRLAGARQRLRLRLGLSMVPVQFDAPHLQAQMRLSVGV